MDSGKLILVATPIGNLGDWCDRAREALASADIIAAEDTRVSRQLVERFSITSSARWVSYREQTEHTLAPELANEIAHGKTICLLSDAGVPAINDPGFRLVRECRKRGLPVTGVPGPNAAIHALALSGLPTDRFLFAGFAPPKRSGRERFFTEESAAAHTVVFFESCHRIEKCLDDMERVLGNDRIVCVARELTKLHETILTGPLGEVRTRLASGSRKGEFVVCVAKAGYTL